jgi:hypothetical protein
MQLFVFRVSISHTHPSSVAYAEDVDGRLRCLIMGRDARRALELVLPKVRAAFAGGLWDVTLALRFLEPLRCLMVHKLDTKCVRRVYI